MLTWSTSFAPRRRSPTTTIRDAIRAGMATQRVLSERLSTLPVDDETRARIESALTSDFRRLGK